MKKKTTGVAVRAVREGKWHEKYTDTSYILPGKRRQKEIENMVIVKEKENLNI